MTSYQETESHEAFAAGNAAFMRNWPYAYSVSQDGAVKGKFDVTVLPHAGANPSVGTAGGWLLGISKFSKKIPVATEFVRYTEPKGPEVHGHLQHQPAHDPGRGQGSFGRESESVARPRSRTSRE